MTLYYEYTINHYFLFSVVSTRSNSSESYGDWEQGDTGADTASDNGDTGEMASSTSPKDSRPPRGDHDLGEDLRRCSQVDQHERTADLGIEGRSTNNSEGGLESGERQDMNMEQSKKYVCIVCACGKEFKHKKTLKRHELYFHQELSSQTFCTQCGKRFKHPQSLKDHLVLHEQGEAFDGKQKTY